MQTDDATSHVEAETRAVTDGLRREERIEDPRSNVLRDTRAIVRDSNENRIAARRGRYCDVALVANRIDGVVDQLLPHLIDLAAESLYVRKVGGCFETHCRRLGSRLPFEH